MESTFVTIFDIQRANELKEKLIEQGFIISIPTYTVFQAKKKGISCTLYTSGKLTVQGKDMQPFIQYFLEPEILQSFSYGYEKELQDTTERIGIDESGKGDFFGPLCVAGVFGDAKTIPQLSEMGVKDSKRLNEKTILQLAKKIRALCPYHILRLSPTKYNELYSRFGNLNLLLAWGHATVIDSLVDKTNCHKVIIDQFAAEHVVENALKKKNKEVFLTQKTHAEQDVIVAAASILAREAFVEGLDKLGQEAGLILPKGASAQVLAAGKQLVKEKGPSVLPTFAKMHFKTSKEVLEELSNDSP